MGRGRNGWVGTCKRRKFPDCNSKLRGRKPRQQSRGVCVDKATLITLSSWVFPSRSLKRLLPGTGQPTGHRPALKRISVTRISSTVELGNPVKWRVGESRDLAMELWCGRKTENLVGVIWVRTQGAQQCKSCGQTSFRGLGRLLGTVFPLQEA